MKSVLYLFSYIFLGIYITGCQEDPGSLTLPNDGLDKDYILAFTDSTTVRTSTVLLDSIPTSDLGALLLGKYSDEKLGRVEATPFFMLGIGPTAFKKGPHSTVTFDSLVLMLQYSGYYQGDTLQSQSFEVREIVEDFNLFPISNFWAQELDLFRPGAQDLREFLYPINSLYNKSEFEANPFLTLGTFSVAPRPNTTIGAVVNNTTVRFRSSKRVRLDPVLGQSWLTEMQKDSGAFSTQNNFLHVLKGVTIRSTSPDASSIFGIDTDSTGTDGLRHSRLKIRMYYKENNVQKTYDFPLLLNSYNFTNISADYTGTKLESIAMDGEVPSTITDHQTYVQSGVGLLTKIRFPHLKKLLDVPGLIRINNARLIIEPIKTNIPGSPFPRTNPFPENLILFQTDTRNLPLMTMKQDFTDVTLQASLQEDLIHNTTLGYSFPITQYIQAILDSESNSEAALLLSMPQGQILRTVDRIYLGDGQGGDFRMRLEVYYLKQKQ
jgi:hypothetical protein